jgi:hypothetical protein
MSTIAKSARNQPAAKLESGRPAKSSAYRLAATASQFIFWLRLHTELNPALPPRRS